MLQKNYSAYLVIWLNSCKLDIRPKKQIHNQTKGPGKNLALAKKKKKNVYFVSEGHLINELLATGNTGLRKAKYEDSDEAFNTRTVLRYDLVPECKREKI